MFYSCLKILHILSATLLLTSVAYSCQLWYGKTTPQEIAKAYSRIQNQTWILIAPLAMLQLATGFTMLSLKGENFSQTWILGSVFGFIILIGSWFSFIYFLLQAQYISIENNNPQSVIDKYKFFRRAQSLMLILCLSAFMAMIFFMSNKASIF